MLSERRRAATPAASTGRTPTHASEQFHVKQRHWVQQITHTCTKQMQIEGIADEMALLTLNVTSSTSFLADCQTVAKQH